MIRIWPVIICLWYLLINSELAHSQVKIFGFDKNASTPSDFPNLLKLNILGEIGKPVLYATIGVSDVVGNDETTVYHVPN